MGIKKHTNGQLPIDFDLKAGDEFIPNPFLDYGVELQPIGKVVKVIGEQDSFTILLEFYDDWVSDNDGIEVIPVDRKWHNSLPTLTYPTEMFYNVDKHKDECRIIDKLNHRSCVEVMDIVKYEGSPDEWTKEHLVRLYNTANKANQRVRIGKSSSFIGISKITMELEMMMKALKEGKLELSKPNALGSQHRKENER